MTKLALSLRLGAALALGMTNSFAKKNVRGARDIDNLDVERKLDGLPFSLPECYEGPEMIEKDSSDLEMCYYNEDMVQINQMNTDSVTVSITDVWSPMQAPGQLRVFVHTDSVSSISQGFWGFECLEDDGTEIEIVAAAGEEEEFTVQCFQAGPAEPFLAVVDVVITDDHICGTNEVPHPCKAGPILESCSWRIVIPCEETEMCDYEEEEEMEEVVVEDEVFEVFTDDLETFEEVEVEDEIFVLTDDPTSAPTAKPTVSPAPTFLLPECYEGPKLIEKDSSDIDMCHYNEGMVQFHSMDENYVAVAIDNVWAPMDPPEEMRVYVHTDGVDALSKDGGGFQCMSDEGSEIDIQGDNAFDVQCHRAGPDEALLAVIDVVITDPYICGTNSVSHPCYPDGEPILESCSWRIVIPCEENEMCTDAPTSGPSSSPSESPSAAPSLQEAITEPPNDLDTLGENDDTTSNYVPPLGPNECPEDVVLIQQEGVTEYVNDTVVILSQDTTSVTVALQQMYTSPSESIDHVFYNYRPDPLDMKCYEEENVPGHNRIEITIECVRSSQIALLEYWMADDIGKGVLAEGDNAIIPKCCHPDVPEETPVTKYYLEIKCVSSCPEASE